MVTQEKPVKLRQPRSLLILRLIVGGIFFFFSMWVLFKTWHLLARTFPQILNNLEPSSFIGSPIFIWGTFIYILWAIGIYLWWRSIYIRISQSKVVVHSGIIIRQQQVLKRLGISIRSIELRRTFLSTLLNFVTVEVGSEILGGVVIVIDDNEQTLQTITSALQPGEINETKKLF